MRYRSRKLSCSSRRFTWRRCAARRCTPTISAVALRSMVAPPTPAATKRALATARLKLKAPAARAVSADGYCSKARIAPNDRPGRFVRYVQAGRRPVDQRSGSVSGRCLRRLECCECPDLHGPGLADQGFGAVEGVLSSPQRFRRVITKSQHHTKVSQACDTNPTRVMPEPATAAKPPAARVLRSRSIPDRARYVPPRPAADMHRRLRPGAAKS